MIEMLDRRIFGAVELLDDLSGDRVSAPLQVRAAGLDLLRNRLGLWVIRGVPGQDPYTRAFDGPPARPARTSFRFEVTDPTQRFLPLAADLPLPRWLPTPQDDADDPVAPADDARVPIALRLLPGPAAIVRAGSAVLRLRIEDAADGVGLANVLVEATPPAALGLPRRRTFTDRHGEALLVIPGAPSWLPGAGPTGLTDVFVVDLSLVYDLALVARADAREFAIPDPAQVLSRLDAAADGVERRAGPSVPLSAGRSRRHVEPVALL